jgi:KDO2-lipid IV(A) lauroyltransferase
MQEIVQQLGWRLQALLLGLFWSLVGLLPPERASAFGARLGRLIGPWLEKHRHVLANLRVAFPDRGDAEIQELGREVWGNLGATLAEYPHLGALTDMDRDDPYLEVCCAEGDCEALRARAPVVFISAHVGNWELSPVAAFCTGLPVDVVYNPQRNPYLDAMVQRRREVLPCGFVPRKMALRKLFRSLKQGRSVGLLVDYRVDDGMLVPFFGEDAKTTPAAAWLAVKTRRSIVPVQVERVSAAHPARRPRFRITFHAPIRPDSSPQDEAFRIVLLTREINRRVEAFVAAHPDQWWCTKRRWPKQAMKQRGAYKSSRQGV